MDRSAVKTMRYASRLALSALCVLVTISICSKGHAQIAPGDFFKIPTQGCPVCFASYDLNNDGYPDIVMSSYLDSALAVLYNQKGVGFGNPIVSKVKNAPRKFVMGDLNGDGVEDVVGIREGVGAMVFLGSKDGTFQETSDYALSSNPISLALADLRGDQKLDMVVLDSKTGKAVVCLGNGDGTFGAPVSYDVGQSPTEVKVSDVTGDKIPDLIVATNDQKDSNDEVMVLPGKGDGTFGAPVTTRLEKSNGASPSALAVGDLNKDSLNDIVAVYGHGTGDTLSVLIANGHGGYGEQTVYAGMGVVQIELTDMDGDGAPDIVALNRDGATISVFLNRDNGTRFVRADYLVTPASQCMAIADFDKDKHPDIFCFSYLNGRLAYNMLKGLRGGALSATPSIPLDLLSPGILVADFNGDKIDDVFGFRATPGMNAMLLGDGKGGFMPLANPLSNSDLAVFAFASGDFNGDGKQDIAIFSMGQFPGITVYYGNGDGTFTRGPTCINPPVVTPAVLVAADINHDGKADLVMASRMGNVDVLINNGNGSFHEAQQLKGSSDISSIAIGDIDGDGILDIAALDRNGDDGYVRLYQGLADGKFRYRNSVHISGNTTFVTLHDVNGDGRPDLVVTSNSPISGSVNISMSADRFFDFAPPRVYNVGSGAQYCIFDDFDNDGTPDILVPCLNDDSVCMLKGMGGGQFAASVAFEGGFHPTMLASPGIGWGGDILVADFGARAIAVLTPSSTKRAVPPNPHLSTAGAETAIIGH